MGSVTQMHKVLLLFYKKQDSRVAANRTKENLKTIKASYLHFSTGTSG